MYIWGHNSRDMSVETKRKISVKTRGELNPFYGRHHTIEAIAKMTAPHLGKPLSKEHRAKISKANTGRVVSEETRVKLRKANTGKHLSAETKAKLSQATKAQRIRVMGMPNSIDRTGTHHNKETRAKMRANHKGMTGLHPTEETKAKMRKAQQGKVASLETRQKMSQHMKGKYAGEANYFFGKHFTGESHPNWRGGIRFEPYSKEFNKELKLLIRVRDGFTCQLCGMPECENNKALTSHHIDYNKKNSLPNNLISLCNSCNAKVNFNREYWTEYFRDLLNKRQLNPKAHVNRKKVPINNGELGVSL
jgi:5-methylcytosine-specific restriction endonuclease McrA